MSPQRNTHCRTCDGHHPPPTGKHCPALFEQDNTELTPAAAPSQDTAAILAVIAEMGQSNQAVLDCVERLEVREQQQPVFWSPLTTPTARDVSRLRLRSSRRRERRECRERRHRSSSSSDSSQDNSRS